jgi:hypothetical protein
MTICDVSALYKLGTRSKMLKNTKIIPCFMLDRPKFCGSVENINNNITKYYGMLSHP